MSNATNLVRFPDNTYRAIVGEYWHDGSYDECVAWLAANGVEMVSLGSY